MLEGFVVAGEPALGSGGAAVDVIPHEVFQLLGGVPLHEHRRLGVPGGDHLARGRGDACGREEPIKKTFSGLLEPIPVDAGRRRGPSGCSG